MRKLIWIERAMHSNGAGLAYQKAFGWCLFPAGFRDL